MGQTLFCMVTLLLLKTIFSCGHAQDAELTHEPNSTILFHGESVTFICNMKEGQHSNWYYKFHRNGHQIVSNLDMSNFLQLHLTTDLSGNYQCTGYHKDSPSFIKQSNNITLFVLALRPTPTVTADGKTILEGGTSKLTCSVEDSAGWKYDWFMHNYSEAQIKSNAVKNSLSIYSGGIYWCRGRRGNPDFFTEPSEKFYIEKSLSNRATVALQHNWTPIYRGEMISMRCEIEEGGKSEWEYEWRTTISTTPSTGCTINIRASTSYNGDFWCKGRTDPFSSTKWSHAYHLRVSYKPRPTVRADKGVIPIGGNVTLTCNIDNPTEWKYHWFRHTGNFSEIQIIGEGKSENVISISQGGIYSCQGGRGNPVYFTEESNGITIEKRVSNMAVVSLEPSWPLIFTGEMITVRCEISGGEKNEWVYEWSKPISDTLPKHNEIRIANASESSSGNYRCLGKHKWDTYSSTEWSNTVSVTVSEQRPKAQVIADRDFSPGSSVTLTCSGKPSSHSWNYYWYRDENTSKPLELNSPSNGEIIISENGIYFCRGGRGHPIYYTEYSHSVTIDITDTNRAAVTQQPIWPEIYYGEKITLICEIQGHQTDWVFEWMRTSRDEPWIQNEMNITLLFSFHEEYFWCKGRRKSVSHSVTSWSAPFKSKRVNWQPVPVLTVSPSWLSPGASVTLKCEVQPPSTGWRFYWYKALPDLSHKYGFTGRLHRGFYPSEAYQFELLPDSINGTVQDFYIIHGQKHTVGYACRAGRGNPEYSMDYSKPNFVWSADSHPAASLTVSPDRGQHFTSEFVTLSCGRNSTQWRVRTFSQDTYFTLPYWQIWDEINASTKIIRAHWTCSAVYWCESESGEFSNAINITIYVKEPLLPLAVN
ncbi:hypothetical protein ILYODFUR_019714 [Ilyodon furcidens]|uniref:Ig-like domain-containing protein n=1 Tax=Ilyodon furcidens TaxID=33524 RepID=A0ABV0UJC8_9TELE